MIVQNGQSAYVVLLPAQPTATESFAVSELVRYVTNVTGVTLPVVNDGKWDEKGRCLSVGNTRLFSRPLNPLEEARHDRFLIKRVRENVLLNGNNRRGVLYAVYRFLEACAGLSFALAGDEHVPRAASIPFPGNDVMEQAHMAKREIVGHPSEVATNLERMDYLAKNLGNSIQFTLSHWRENREALLPETTKRGLEVTIGGHIYSDFLPEDAYFDEHPEWFPELNGERTRGTGQVCYSERGVEVLVHQLVRGLEESWADPIRRLSLWYGDNALLCACEKCRQRTFYDQYMMLVSRLKKELGDAGLPSIALDFCIYNCDNEHKSDLTLLSPAFTERPDNINLFYSYWGRDYTQPLSDSASPFDSHSFKCVREWCRLFKSAEGFPRVGEYYADSNQLTPMAPVIPDRIKDDVLTYKSVGMDGMHVCIHLWWSPYPDYPMFWVMSFNLHAYLRFAWNPNLSVGDLFRPMLGKYFGEAAKEAEEILGAVREAVLPLTRYNLAGPVCSLAGTILWHVRHVPGGPRYTFDPEVDEFASFRRELLVDLTRAVEIVDKTQSVYNVFLQKVSKETTSVQNFIAYYSFCRGNLRSKLLQARAQGAIVNDNVQEARSLLLEVFKLEGSLYGRGTDDIVQWFGIYKDSAPVKALGLEADFVSFEA